MTEDETGKVQETTRAISELQDFYYRQVSHTIGVSYFDSKNCYHTISGLCACL